MVATCVGEEGLDIGEVDLIVCFDAHASPIRLVQRMGRTGRKRDGRIVVLVTEGKEEQVLNRHSFCILGFHTIAMIATIAVLNEERKLAIVFADRVESTPLQPQGPRYQT